MKETTIGAAAASYLRDLGWVVYAEVQAALEWTYEGGTDAAVKKEAIHRGAMAVRFLMHLDDMVPRRSPQVRTPTRRR